MTNVKMMVIRTSDDDKQEIWAWLQKGELRQGWGISGLQLIEDGQLVPPDLWTKRYRQNGKEYWKADISEAEASKRYFILSSMTQLRKDDIVVVPKMPDWTTLTIARVDRGYEFDSAKRTDPSMDDFRHVIWLAKESIRTYSYSLCDEARTVSKKLRGYQRAVNNVLDSDFLVAVTKLFSMESDTTEKRPQKLFRETMDKITGEIHNSLKSKHPIDLEKLVVTALENSGFTICKKNSFDKMGGDADIVATMSLPLISDVTGFDLKIYIQVKHKDGIDLNDIEGVKQLQKISEGETNCLKVLMTTADRFTDAAKNLAEQESVILINGLGVAASFRRYL